MEEEKQTGKEWSLDLIESKPKKDQDLLMSKREYLFELDTGKREAIKFDQKPLPQFYVFHLDSKLYMPGGIYDQL